MQYRHRWGGAPVIACTGQGVDCQPAGVDLVGRGLQCLDRLCGFFREQLLLREEAGEVLDQVAEGCVLRLQTLQLGVHLVVADGVLQERVTRRLRGPAEPVAQCQEFFRIGIGIGCRGWIEGTQLPADRNDLCIAGDASVGIQHGITAAQWRVRVEDGLHVL